MGPKLKDIIEIMAQYNVRQVSRMKDCGDIDANKKLIRIDSKQTPIARTATLIHEAIHGYYFDREIIHTKKRVNEEMNKLMRELYGNEYGK